MSQLIVDLVNNGSAVQTLMYPIALTQSGTNAAVDASNFDVSVNAILSIGSFNGTNLNVQVEGCSTSNGTFAAVTGMVFTGQTVNGASTQLIVRGQPGPGVRYLRANVTTFTGTSIVASVVCVSQGKFVSQSASGASNAPLQA